MSKTTDLLTEIDRLKQENETLRAENRALRPMIAALRHDAAVKCRDCEYVPHDLKRARGKDRADATTRTYTHG